MLVKVGQQLTLHHWTKRCNESRTVYADVQGVSKKVAHPAKIF